MLPSRRDPAQPGAGTQYVTLDWLMAQVTALLWHSDTVESPKPV